LTLINSRTFGKSRLSCPDKPEVTAQSQ
jgi:hypothetical protein